jgi:hypothetical protein
MQRSTSLLTSLSLVLCLLTLAVGCSGATPSEDIGGTFQALSGDEAIDPSDPPTDPDPSDAQGYVEASAPKAACPSFDKLSPTGLTFVIDIVDASQLDDLLNVKDYIRARDVFVVRASSGPVDALEKQFPCNRVMALVFPDELKDLASLHAQGVTTAIIDWEGSDQSGTIQNARLDAINKQVRAHGMGTGVAPGTRWVDTAAAANDRVLLAQTQPSCKAGVTEFGAASHRLSSEAKDKVGLRDVAAEISLDSSESGAQNHVDADRAVGCARAGYGHGARALYIFGQQAPHLTPFFHGLRATGLRSPR